MCYLPLSLPRDDFRVSLYFYWRRVIFEQLESASIDMPNPLNIESFSATPYIYRDNNLYPQCTFYTRLIFESPFL